MQAVVFIPGTLGTELHARDGELLWPPKLHETQFGYGRLDQLLDEGVVPGAIIRKVACVGIYDALFDQFDELGFKPGGTGKRLYAFPYDWRLDLETTAQALAAQLDAVHLDGATEIHLVAHSMGGLVTRLVIESKTYAARPWLASIRSFISLAVPHKGAPLALARVLGLDSAMGLSKADFRRLTSDRRYPSGYQLLPAPGEEACWNQSDAALAEVDIYDDTAAAELGLDPELMARTRYVHASLDEAEPPPHVRYFYFAGTGHGTLTRVNVRREGAGPFPHGRMEVTRTPDAGDGTVPSWSALPRKGQKQVVINEHSTVFKGMAFKAVFYRLLGGNLGDALQAIEQGLMPDPDALRLSMSTQVIESAKAFELLLIPRKPVGHIEGALVLRKLGGDGDPAPGPGEALADVTYQGAPVSTLCLTMPALADGLYQLTFEGQPVNTAPIRFAVVDFGGHAS